MNRPLGPIAAAAEARSPRPIWAWGVLAATLALLPVIGVGLKNVKLSNDTETWMPLDDPRGQILRWHQDAFNTNDTILVSWEGSTLNDPRVEALAARLNGESGEKPFGVEEATAPHKALANMVELEVPLDEATRRLRGIFIGSGFLKVRLTDYGRAHRSEVENALTAAGAELGLDVEVRPPVVEPKPWLRETSDDDSELVRPFAAIPAHDLQLRWKEISPASPQAETMKKVLGNLEVDGQPIVAEAFFAYGSPVAISVSFNDDAMLHQDQAIDGLYAAVEAEGIDRDDLHIGGGLVAGQRLSAESARALWNPEHPLWKFYKRSPVLLSGIVGMVIAFLVLRSIWLAAIVMMVSVYSAATMLAVVAATGTELNLVLVVMPNLLMVITLSGAIHLANYWCHAVADGDPQPVKHAVQTAWQPCVLASVTTAIGLMSLLTSKLTPVQDFGWYSAWGCLLSLVLVLVVLPAILAIFPPHGAAAMTQSKGRWEALGSGIFDRHGWIVGASCVLLVTSAFGLRYFRTETKGIRYFPEHTRIVQDYRFLEESLSGIINLDVDIRFPGKQISDDEEESTPDFNRRDVFDRMQIVKRVEDIMAEHAAITGTLSVVDFQVIPEPPGSNASPRERVLYARRAQRTENELFHNQREGAGQFVQLVDQPLSVILDDRALDWRENDEVWRVRAQCSVMADLSIATLLREIDQTVSQSLDGEEGVEYAVTGLVPLMLRTQQEVLDSLIRSFGLAFVLIAVVITIVLRNPLAGLITMFPNFLPVLVVFGLVSWAGLSVDMGTMITASVALGIAVDGTLHQLTWFQEGIRKGLSRREAVSQALGHCGPAMWQTSVSISLGLFMLWGADLLLISRFGWLMATLIMLALVSDIILTPALLSGTLGRLLEQVNRNRIAVPLPSMTITQSDAAPMVGASLTPAESNGEPGESAESPIDSGLHNR